MSYNIFFGAGADPAYELKGLSGPNNPLWRLRGNHLGELIELLRSVNPDVIGIQEAASWEDYNLGVARDVASELGYYYFVAESPFYMKTALFSRFPIVHAVSLFDYLGPPGGLAAVLEMPDGGYLTVFVIHFDATFGTPGIAARTCQTQTLLALARPYFQGRALLLGDFNFDAQDANHREIMSADWRPIGSGLLFDFIWASPGLLSAHEEISMQYVWYEFNISDHLPVAARLKLTAPTEVEPILPEAAPPGTGCQSQ